MRSCYGPPRTHRRRPPGRPDRRQCETGGRSMAYTKLLPPRRFATTVLLIDSFKEDRQYWAERLHISSPNFVVLEADTGAAGLAICRSQRIDCVILELNLPDMPGFETLVKLVPRALQPEIAVIMLSRIRLLPLAELAKKNGAQAFLVKSYASGDQLSMAIHKAIAKVALKELPVGEPLSSPSSSATALLPGQDKPGPSGPTSSVA